MIRPTLSWKPRRRKPADSHKKPALPPGSLIHVGDKRSKATTIRCIRYDEEAMHMNEIVNVEEAKANAARGGVTWIRVSGLHEIDKISAFGEAFQIDPLVLEDVLNTTIRPKIEEKPDFIFVVIKQITIESESGVADLEQCSLLLLPNDTVITFHESPARAFDPVVERIRTGGAGRIRRLGGDYLLWALLDTMVDHYMIVANHMDDAMAILDDRLQDEPDEVAASELYSVKRDVTSLYRHIRPTREIMNFLIRRDTPLIEAKSFPYYQDLHDHVTQVVEAAEDLRENSSSLRDFYLSAVSNRMNEVMKVLTCFSTIFLPLSFLAGLYGMNFQHMPELAWPWAYPALWCIFIIAASGMIWLFKRKRWL